MTENKRELEKIEYKGP